MAAYEIDSETYELLGYDLATEIADYQARLAGFATPNVPAPTAHALVEQIAKEFGGEFVIVPPAEARVKQPLPKDPSLYRSADEQAAIAASAAPAEAKPKKR